MSSISNLAKKTFKENKVKSSLVIITIMLATALLTSLGIIAHSAQIANIKRIENMIGKAHCRFMIKDNKQLEVLKNNTKIEKAGQVIPFGQCEDEKLKTTSLTLANMDKDFTELMNIKLKSGHFPEKSNEIALEDWIIERLNIKPNIGETVHLKIIKQMAKEDVWANKKPSKIEKDFVLCGILNGDSDERNYYSQGLVSEKFVYENLEEKSISREAYLRFNSTKNIMDNIYDLGESMGIMHQNISPNKLYLGALGAKFQDSLPFIIIGIVVILAAVIVIYNIFYVSITDKVQGYGLLAAIGATKGQIRKLIMIDGLWMSSIGISIGVLLGYILSYIVCNATKHFGSEVSMKVSPYIILMAIGISLFTVIISLIKPARMASKISPMQAIRFSDYQISTKKKQRKSSSAVNIKKLAYFNLWRNKKRTLMTIFSLSMSGLLFIVVSSVLLSMDIDSNLRDTIQNDFQLTSYHVDNDDGKSNPLNSEFITKVKSIDGIKDIKIVNHSYVWLDKSIVSENNTKIASDKVCCNFYGFGDDMLNQLKKYLVDGKLSLQDLKNNNEVILVTNSKGRCVYNVGDKVLLKKTRNYVDVDNKEKISESDKEDNNSQYIEFKVAGIVTSNIEDLKCGYDGYCVFITHFDTYNKTMKDNRPVQLRIDIEKDKYDNISKTLKQITNNEGITTIDYKEWRGNLEKQAKVMGIIIYSIVSIIGIIGVLNLINTMVTSIFTRKKEIGMLQAIGLSKNQSRKMFQIEGLYYALISGVISIVGGIGIGYLAFRIFKSKATYAIYKFPLIPIILFVVVLLLVQILITYIVGRILEKKSIIENIKFAE
ncbi:FtsX-like permease family protein [Clostridium lundense]|uniref:FtsX-like permease family protein n=1 Tax=Clostridium lundense TaxID=319475 RepID=UPI00048319A7|nr:FtsX-like permease family protein [Clostridium lundense]